MSIISFDSICPYNEKQFTLMMSSCPAGNFGPTALSLVNEAQFLLINRASVSFLQKHIANRYSHASYKWTIQYLLLQESAVYLVV